MGAAAQLLDRILHQQPMSDLHAMAPQAKWDAEQDRVRAYNREHAVTRKKSTAPILPISQSGSLLSAIPDVLLSAFHSLS
jgi:hypothetical protein